MSVFAELKLVKILQDEVEFVIFSAKFELSKIYKFTILRINIYFSTTFLSSLPKEMVEKIFFYGRKNNHLWVLYFPNFDLISGKMESTRFCLLKEEHFKTLLKGKTKNKVTETGKYSVVQKLVNTVLFRKNETLETTVGSYFSYIHAFI